MHHALIEQQFKTLILSEADLYKGINAFCEWFNKTMTNYQIILDDEWFDDKTTIEYQLRSIDTFNIFPIAVDTYQNRKDTDGVWHLGDYVETRWMVENPLESIFTFFAQNTPIQSAV